MVQNSQSSYITKPRYDLYLGLTNADTVGACAFHYKNVNFIAVNWGTIAYLTYFFHLAFSFQDVFKDFGESEKEANLTTNLLKLTDNAYDLFAAVSPMVAPKSSQRRILAQNLSEIAYQYIINHEIAHVRHGHVGLLEESRLGNEKLSQEDRYAMEFDADSMASMCALNYAIELKDFFKTSIQGFSKSHSVLEDSFFFHFFAVYMFFRIYVDKESVYQHYSKHHPPSFFRMFACLTISAERNPFDDREIHAKNVARIICEGESAAALLTNKKIDLSGIQMATQESGLEMVKDLNQYWANVRPKLLKRAYSTLAL